MTRLRHPLPRISLFVVVGSIAVGALSFLGQRVLPSWIYSLSDSAGAWTMFMFLFVWLAGSRPAMSAVWGLLSFVLMIVSFAIVSNTMGYEVPFYYSGAYVAIAILAGPVVGLCAGVTRHGRPAAALVGVSVLSGLLVLDGVVALLGVGDFPSPAYWVIEILAGGVFAALAVRRLVITRSS